MKGSGTQMLQEYIIMTYRNPLMGNLSEVMFSGSDLVVKVSLESDR